MMEYPARDSTKLFCACSSARSCRRAGICAQSAERSVVPRGRVSTVSRTLGASVTASINAAFVFVVKMSKSRIQHARRRRAR